MNHTSKLLIFFFIILIKIQFIDLEPDVYCNDCFIHTLPLIDDISYYKLSLNRTDTAGSVILFLRTSLEVEVRLSQSCKIRRNSTI